MTATTGPRQPLTVDELREAVDLYLRGLTLVEIARTVPRSVETIRRGLRVYGVRMRKRGPRPGRANKPKGNSR